MKRLNAIKFISVIVVTLFFFWYFFMWALDTDTDLRISLPRNPHFSK